MNSVSPARPRILILQPSLNPAGGGNGVAVWALEALKDHDLTVFAWEPPDWDAINAYYGTELGGADVRVLLVPRPFDLARRASRLDLSLMQRCILLRHGRRLAGDHDLVMSFNNEIDVGRRAVQYIHFPWGFWPRPEEDLRWFHRLPGVLRLYYALGEWLAPVSREGIAANRTLANSEWTAARFAEVYGGAATTLFPPACGARLPLPWAERADRFVVVGRITPHKRIETAIEIVERVRGRGHEVELAIVGSRVERSYERHLRALARRRSWVDLHFDASRAELESILASSRYGLHAFREEHFGIAIAEMMLSGCIPFVPNDGGQLEIIDGDPRLAWHSVEDAVDKIVAVIADEQRQAAIRSELEARAGRFSWPRFRDGLRAALAEELACRTMDGNA